MSFERSFDKLDDKISSLLRSMGLLSTILFGFSAIILNYFKINIIMGIIILVVIGLFIGNIMYTLFLIIYVSPKNDDFLTNIDLYKQIIKISENLNRRSREELRVINQKFNDFKIYEYIDESKLQANVLKEIEKYKLDQDDDHNYIFKYKDIEEFRFNLGLYNNLLNSVVFYVIGLLYTDDKNRQEKIHSYSRKLRNFCDLIIKYYTDISDFQNLNFEDTRLFSIDIKEDLFLKFTIVIQSFCFDLINSYGKITAKKQHIKKSFEKKIRWAYIFFGIGIIASGVTIFIVILFIILPYIKI